MSNVEADLDLVTELRLSVGRLARRLRQLEAGGLTPSQLSALATVDRLGPLRLSELAAAEGISAPTTTKIVGHLEQAELVVRTTDADDRRCTLLTLTPAGRTRLKTIRSQRNAYLRQRLQDLGADERATLAAAVPILRALTEEPG
jgi:DNA-binding MarR family transcriptional regulator